MVKNKENMNQYYVLELHEFRNFISDKIQEKFFYACNLKCTFETSSLACDAKSNSAKPSNVRMSLLAIINPKLKVKMIKEGQTS